MWMRQISFNNQVMSQNQATYIQNHIMRRFNVLKKVGSGAYGHVWKVEEKTTKRIYALKKIFDAFQHATDAQRTYREIQILKQLSHPNIIKLHDTMHAENNKDVYLLFEFMEADLHNVISEGILKEVHIKFIIYQMAKALRYLHTGSIIHRDLKPSNILVNSNCSIRLCDFGLVRSLGKVQDNQAVLTQGVATRWYRAPQVLLGSRSYSTPADIWSFGCIIYEILAQKPLFPGNSTLDQLQKICQFTGYPSQQEIDSLESEVAKSMIKEIKIPLNSKSNNFLKQFSAPFPELLEGMLAFNPHKRLTVQDILNHEAVKAFHKPEEQVACEAIITTSVDDNKKYAVDQYRKLVYGISTPKAKGLSASLGSGVNSAKYLQTGLNKTNVQSPSTSTYTVANKTVIVDRGELSKKYSNEKFRTTTVHTTYTKGAQVQKKIQRPTLKYVKSAKDMTKNIENISQNSYKKSPQPSVLQHKQQYKVEPKRQSQSGYIASKPYYNKSFESKGDSGWKAVKTNVTSVYSPKEIKDKTALFKAPKYINISKNESLIRPASKLDGAKPSN